MTLQDFLLELEHIAGSGSNEIRLGELYKKIVSSHVEPLQKENEQVREAYEEYKSLWPADKFRQFSEDRKNLQSEITRLKEENNKLNKKETFTCRVCGEHEKEWSRKNDDWYCKTCGHICNPN